MPVSRILLVAGSANFSTRDVWDGYRVGLELAGCEVVPYPTFAHLKILSADAVCRDLIGTAVDEAAGIDAAVFIDGLYFRGRRSRVPASIRRAGVPTALVATDDPYDPIPNAESLYSLRLTNDAGTAGDGAVYLPTAAGFVPEASPQPERAYAVSFIGTVFPERLPYLLAAAEWCERSRRRMLVAGKLIDTAADPFAGFALTETRLRTIDGPEKWAIYAQSDLTLNVFRRDPETGPPAVSPSPRVFEVAAFGHAALLTGPSRTEMSETFGDAVYGFETPDDLPAAIEAALSDGSRGERVERAKAIVRGGHTYEHRAADLLTHLRDLPTTAAAGSASPAERDDRIAWIIGCGRSGSTWLAELLGELPGVRRWHEPYFGRFLRHLHERPDDLDRPSSFFSRRHHAAWVGGLRRLFFDMVADRYPQFPQHALAVKEVNTPELYPWLRTLFPASPVVLLVRDPFDVLDSYLALQKAGSWNERFGTDDSDEPDGRSAEFVARRTASNIAQTMTLALDTFEDLPPGRRLRVSYEQLLTDGTQPLAEVAALLGASPPAEAIAAAIEKHAFANYAKRGEPTGELAFRRRGIAGGWRDSANFTDEVRAIADEVLGPLRARLGYDGVATSSDGRTVSH